MPTETGFWDMNYNRTKPIKWSNFQLVMRLDYFRLRTVD